MDSTGGGVNGKAGGWGRGGGGGLHSWRIAFCCSLNSVAPHRGPHCTATAAAGRATAAQPQRQWAPCSSLRAPETFPSGVKATWADKVTRAGRSVNMPSAFLQVTCPSRCCALPPPPPADLDSHICADTAVCPQLLLLCFLSSVGTSSCQPEPLAGAPERRPER